MREPKLGRIAAVFLITIVALRSSRPANADVKWDSPMQIPSTPERSAWFPDLAVDSHGRVHVVWSDTDHVAMHQKPKRQEIRRRRRFESLSYSSWDGHEWAPPRRIVPSQQDIVRSAIALDRYDTLHLVLDFSPGSGHDLYYRQGPADEGLRQGGWRAGKLINSRWNTYTAAIGTYGDTIHLVYDDAGEASSQCLGCADIYYRRSPDRGWTWSEPLSLLPSVAGSSRPQLQVDASGTIYVTWDEGWDRYSDRGQPQYGVFTSSADGGHTWLPPRTITYPDSNNAQLTVGASGTGTVVLVWRTISHQHPGVYYMTSSDWGLTWSPPAMLPNFLAREWTDPFDVYAMAADGAGNIHLLATGFPFAQGEAPPQPGQRHGLYSFVWNGTAWSSPTPVYEGAGYPEYPRLVIRRGNELHATWFVRAAPKGEDPPHTVWYARGVALAAHAGPAESAPRPAAYSYRPPAAQPNEPAVASSVPRIRWDKAAVLVGSLLGGGVLVAAVQGWLRLWRRRKRRPATP